jgi:hypothetical protein
MQKAAAMEANFESRTSAFAAARRMIANQIRKTSSAAFVLRN